MASSLGEIHRSRDAERILSVEGSCRKWRSDGLYETYPESGKGRDHHNLGFTMWMAGGGVKAGTVVGATDAIGLHAVERPYHFRDIHTTILHQLGLDQHKLTYPHLGRNERLTFVEGKVVE